jgi:hypothetical protein
MAQDVVKGEGKIQNEGKSTQKVTSGESGKDGSKRREERREDIK